MKLSAFYDDPERGASSEVDFGGWQYHGYGPWRVVWLEATGELVAFNELPPPEQIRFLGSDNPVADLTAEVVIEPVIRAGVELASEVIDHIRHHHVHAPGDSLPADLIEEVSLLTIEPDRARLKAVLAGWKTHVSDRDGLVWLAERLGSPL